MVRNINGLDLDKEQVKDRIMYTFLKDEKINMMGVTETNICWLKTDNKNILWDRMIG